LEPECLSWVGWGKHFAGKNKAYRFQSCGGSRANAMTERSGANRVGGMEWHEQSRLRVDYVLGLSGRHDTESLCDGFAECREGIAFAVRC